MNEWSATEQLLRGWLEHVTGVYLRISYAFCLQSE